MQDEDLLEDEYQFDDFVVMNDEDDVENETKKKKKKKKKGHKRKKSPHFEELDEGDYELLEENLGIKIARKREKETQPGGRKLKRLKRGVEYGGEDRSGEKTTQSPSREPQDEVERLLIEEGEALPEGNEILDLNFCLIERERNKE